ncbi:MULTISPECIES: hypothetical protein [unclassified Enterococcus]|uniref:hypothetical protein n=1 Tax=unclassified Enterococcus TaxID=2608891 RepID=UPI001CE0B277|nr:MULTISPECIES: hypothetical protein [unclassified Enterococcus]MCA5011816.1 hypothetical protein [Enterococcus sp. S23]MCA5014742.1 hypothetical protein [Enterococcus sp. S22(2020)]
MKNNITFLVSLILLAYPVLTLPSIIASKRSMGKFFTDQRLFISKSEGYGSSINRKNLISFFSLLLAGLLFLFLSFN